MGTVHCYVWAHLEGLRHDLVEVTISPVDEPRVKVVAVLDHLRSDAVLNEADRQPVGVCILIRCACQFVSAMAQGSLLCSRARKDFKTAQLTSSEVTR